MSPLQRSLGIEWGVASSTMSGEAHSGDLHLVRPTSTGTIIAVVDGIGHGEPAAAAARRTAEVLERNIDGGVITSLRRCHEALIGTRGVVMSLAFVNVEDDTLTWIGVGNVSGVLLRSDTKATPRYEELLARGGVVGMHLPPLHAAVCGIMPGDILALATDGIRPGFVDSLMTRQPPPRLAAKVLSEHARRTDDALALVARYVGPVSVPVTPTSAEVVA